MSTSRARRAPRFAAAFAALLLLAGCGGTVSTRPNPVGGGQRLVAFASDRNGNFDLFLFDLDTFILYAMPGLNGTSAERRPALGSDGKVLAFATDRASGMGGFDILIYDLTRSQMAPTPPINTAANEDDPAFTGDVLKLAFTRDTLGVRRIRMYDGVNQRYVLLPGLDGPGGASDHDPSPDQTGARIAFVSDRNGNADVFVYDAAGDSLMSLPGVLSDSTDTDPALSADGRYLCFASTRPGGAGGFDLYLYDLQTRAFVALDASVNGAADERRPSLNQNASVLVFQSNRASGQGQWDVWNHNRGSGATGQGTGQSGAKDDIEPSLRWP